MPGIYTEAKMAQNEALIRSKPHILKAWKEMGDVTGRYYRPVETYKTEGAETVFLSMGSTGDTVAMAVDELRDQGKSVGLIKLRLWRPFPFDELREAAKGAKRIIVLDRAVSYGGPGGPVASEIRSVLYGEDNMPEVTNFICGLAGRDVTPKDYIGDVSNRLGRWSGQAPGRKTTCFTESENNPDRPQRQTGPVLRNGVPHMETLNVYATRLLEKKEYFSPGSPGLPGLRRSAGGAAGGQGLGQQRDRGQRHRLHGNHLVAAAVYQLEGALAARGL